jgi:hypothetical protein
MKNERTILGRASETAQVLFVKVREGRFFRVFSASVRKFHWTTFQNLTFAAHLSSENGATAARILADVLRFRRLRGFNFQNRCLKFC